MARRAMDPEGPIPEMACYHSQQCAEKYRKGYLISQNIDFLYVHDLVYLTQRCMERKQAFTELEQAARILSLPLPRRGLGGNKTCRGSRNLCEEPTLRRRSAVSDGEFRRSLTKKRLGSPASATGKALCLP